MAISNAFSSFTRKGRYFTAFWDDIKFSSNVGATTFGKGIIITSVIYLVCYYNPPKGLLGGTIPNPTSGNLNPASP